MWGDFPQDAQEAFADAQEDVDRKNYFLDRIIEETMVKVTHEVTLDGIHHSYHHQATWQNILSLPINDRDAPDPSEAGSSSRSSSRSDWSSNSSNISSTSSSKSSDSISTPRGLPPEDLSPTSSLSKSRPPSRSRNSKEENESANGIQRLYRHCRDNSNISSTSGKSSIQSGIDRMSQTDRESLISEQIKEHKDLPPIPSTPILDRLNISSSLRSGDSFRSQLVRRNCPPPIPPRLSERRKKAVPDTPTEAVPQGNGLDDLAGAFDTAAPSPAAVSTENKMASIMGAFGSAPAAQPNPAMGGMGMPGQQNAFGGMGSMQGMGGMPQQTMSQPTMSMPAMSQPAMSMPAMSQPAMSMPALSQPVMSMPAMGQPAMSQPAMSAQSFGGSTSGMMGAASMTPAASQQSPMIPSGGTNMGKAMNDPFADLGGLTGFKPKPAPVAAPTMGMMAASANPPPAQQQSFDSLFG
ncbi:unnamed protein product [Oikopleura dioica]|uniref:Uncharacterized protein n=1 Tax=Oikopleura dioica TaxID=34765 RepID=E4WXC2_OIKDI|nr:unnamed protein product [Oikopleura dioica]